MRSTFQRSTFQAFQSFPNCFQSCPSQLWGPTVLHFVSFAADLAHKMSDLGMCARDSKIQEVLRNIVGVRWVSKQSLWKGCMCQTKVVLRCCTGSKLKSMNSVISFTVNVDIPQSNKSAIDELVLASQWPPWWKMSPGLGWRAHPV